MKPSFFRRLIAWARGDSRDIASASLDERVLYSMQIDERRRAWLAAWIDEELKKPVLFGYADRPRSDDLKALGLKESDFTSLTRPQ